MAESNEGRWRTNPSNTREKTKIVNELAMKAHLDKDDPRGAAAVRAFMQKSNLFDKGRSVKGWGKIATEHDTADTARPSEQPNAMSA